MSAELMVGALVFIATVAGFLTSAVVAALVNAERSLLS